MHPGSRQNRQAQHRTELHLNQEASPPDPSDRAAPADHPTDTAFSREVEEVATELAESERFERVHLHVQRKPPERLPRRSPQRHWHLANAYNAALEKSERDEDFVFLLDGDTVPPTECLPFLYEGLARLHAEGESPGEISTC